MFNINNLLSLKKIFSILISLFIVLGITACSAKAPPPAAPSYFGHTVKFSGETLAVIAAWYTGSAKNWELLAAANPSIKPTRIKIGDVIQIPQDLITRYEPLPKKLLKGIETKPTDAAAIKDKETAPASVTPAPTTTPEASTTPIANLQTPAPDSQTPGATETAPATNPTVAVEPAATDPGDEMVPAFEENIVIEPTPASKELTASSPTLSPEEKAREDLIDEILRK